MNGDPAQAQSVILATRLLQKLESCNLTTYSDDAGYATAGWGQRVEVALGTVFSQDWADKSLHDKIIWCGRVISNAIGINIPLTAYQLAALISFVYNTGTLGATLTAELKNKQYDLVPAAMRMWVHETKNGVKRVSRGLVNRREQEVRMWEGTWIG